MEIKAQTGESTACPYCTKVNTPGTTQCSCGYYFNKAVYEETEESEKQPAEKKSDGGSDMLWGAIWCIGGIIVTAYTYSNAAPGGAYVVAWGAIIFGAVQFIKGLVKS